MMIISTSQVLRRAAIFATTCLFTFLSISLLGQAENPFEIKARADVRLNDSLVVEEDTFSLDSQVSFVEKIQKEKMSENPFNVSHIPIRRLTAEKEKVNTIQEKESSPIDSSKEAIPILLPIAKEEGGRKFLFWFFLIQLLLITSILGINREFIRKVSRSISNDNFAKLIARDYNNGSSALFAILYLLFLLSLSTFIYLASGHFLEIRGFSRFVMFLLAVSGIYIFRHIFLAFMGFVFPFTKAVKYYGFMIILFNSYLGLLLIPINVVIAYSPSIFANIAVYIGIGLIGIMYLLRLLRGTLHAYTFIRNHIFHFFLYLCTCEIAPIFILVRFLSNSFGN